IGKLAIQPGHVDIEQLPPVFGRGFSDRPATLLISAASAGEMLRTPSKEALATPAGHSQHVASNGLYSNTPESGAFLDRNSPNYIGGILEMANARLYRFWADLTEALKTGAPQNETKQSGEPMFAKLYEKPERLEQFMNAMSGVSAGNFKAFAQK